jgi:hypothetical protein
MVIESDIELVRLEYELPVREMFVKRLIGENDFISYATKLLRCRPLKRSE